MNKKERWCEGIMLEKIASKFAAACVIALFASLIAKFTDESFLSAALMLVLTFFSVQIAQKANSILSDKRFLIVIVCISFVLNVLLIPGCYFLWQKWQRSCVMVPDLTGKTMTEAIDELNSCGLAYGDNQDVDAIIISQNPRGGIKVAPGTEMELLIDEKKYEDNNTEEIPVQTEALNEQLQNKRPGETFSWGKYEQDEEREGDEAIEWVVLEVEADRMLIISKFGLDAQPYNMSGEQATWDSSSIRTWLEEKFYYSAFSDEEKELILLTNNREADDEDARSYQGRDTSDHVFLLSVTEFNKYINRNPLLDSNVKFCEPTPYADGDVEKIDTPQYCWWWLRTSANNGKSAYSINCAGTINDGTREVFWKQGAVRPAMWLSLD